MAKNTQELVEMGFKLPSIVGPIAEFVSVKQLC